MIVTRPSADRTSADRTAERSTDRSGPGDTRPVRWATWIALPLIFGVFAAGAVWSFREQTALARSAGFHLPELLPLVIDGFAVAMAAVAWAASLDARAAVVARIGIAVGIACSVAANAAWAWQRSGADRLTVILAGGVPILAMLAFEAVLAEVRRQVQRRRGLPRPDPIPLPRAITVGLSPIRTPLLWRRLVLELTDPRKQFAAVQEANTDGRRPRSARPGAARSETRPGTGATVTPIGRSKSRRTGKQTGHSDIALRDAEAVLDRYGDRLPTRKQLSEDTGWGSPKAGKALKAIPAVRAARRERTKATSADRSGDDEEREAA